MFDALEKALGTPLPKLTRSIERRLFSLRKRLLVELANAHDDGGIKRFHRFVVGLFRPEGDEVLVRFRNDLRRAWLRSTPLNEKQRVVDDWLTSSVGRPGVVGIVAPLRVGRLIPAPENLRMQLALGILENWRRFAICANPVCPARYFLAKRKTQRYCEQACCTTYAQNRRSLKWWSREGNEWRAKRQKKRARLRRKKISSSRKENK